MHVCQYQDCPHWTPKPKKGAIPARLLILEAEYRRIEPERRPERLLKEKS
jgi:hypothetical protein